MRLSWFGSYSQSCAEKISPAVMLFFNSSIVRNSFAIRSSFPSAHKDDLPTNQPSFLFIVLNVGVTPTMRDRLSNVWRGWLRSMTLALYVDMPHDHPGSHRRMSLPSGIIYWVPPHVGPIIQRNSYLCCTGFGRKPILTLKSSYIPITPQQNDEKIIYLSLIFTITYKFLLHGVSGISHCRIATIGSHVFFNPKASTEFR